MKKGFSFLQIGVFVACGVGIILAVLIFSDKLPIGKSSTQTVSGSVVMWGTLPYAAMRANIDSLNKTYKDVRVDYVEKNAATFQSELVNALASGTGPDLITITPAEVLQNTPRITTIPYSVLPSSSFLSVFVDQASLFMNPNGIVAFPLVIDPMVMYYNRDMLTSAFALNPPETWDELAQLNPNITRRDDAGKLSVSTVALGTFDNIKHAKDIVAMLAFQAGNPIVMWDAERKQYVSTWSESTNAGSGVASALQFYTSFANPASSHYTWASTLPTDRDQFVAGKLAVYLGTASELSDIRRRNPNLNFDLAIMPQRSKTATKVTYGTMVGVAVIKMSPNQNLAVTVAQELAKAPGISAYLGTVPGFAPARRDMLGGDQTDVRTTMIARSSIISRSWLDPDSIQTTALLRKIIGDINAGAATPESSLSSGNSLLGSLLSKVQPKPATPTP